MDEYKHHLLRLAVHDDALLESIAVQGSSFPASVIDERTAALVRVAASVAVECGPRFVPAGRGACPRGRRKQG
jgi:hypothetical protein